MKTKSAAIELNGDCSGTTKPSRRQLLHALATAAVGTAAFQRAVAQDAEKTGDASEHSIKDAEWIAGIELTEEQRETALAAVESVLQKRDQMRAVKVDYDTLPAVRFDPEIGNAAIGRSSLERRPWPSATKIEPSDSEIASEDYTFCSIRQLGKLLRQKKVTSVELATHCIRRLKEADSVLKCVVTITEDLALKLAEQADRELAAGMDRGPLHGIPWGAKDLIAVPGYPTTWGAPQFKDRVIDRTATVANRLQEAGAVLVAKLSLGALAMGDKWFGGMTRNPWNPERGSSGSSAGSASAVAAGILPFALGSETLGSIVSPCRRCGVTGLRPTFGRVSRSNCMALSWTMDKIGPIARTLDDCGIVFNAIHGVDPGDPCTVDRWFDWPMKPDLSAIRIGRVESDRTSAADEKTLQVLTELGANIVPIRLPDEFPEWAISSMLDVEAATIFQDLIVAGDTDGLNQWPEIFRKSHFLPAVDYLHASRLRVRLMEAIAQVFETVDLYVGGDDLGICNLTGHPTVVFPTVMTDSKKNPQPSCATMTGQLYDEASLLAVARLVEQHVGLGNVRPVWQPESSE